MDDLDDRLVRYAADLDERMVPFEVPPEAVGAGRSIADGETVGAGASGRLAADGAGSAPPAVESVDPAFEPVERRAARTMWVATAAAVVLVVLVSALWWRGRAPGTVDVVDGPSRVPTTVTTAPDPPPSTVAPDGGPMASSGLLTWAPIEPVDHLSTTSASVPFAGGLLVVGSDDTLRGELRFSPDGRTWVPPVAMSGGVPRAVATDGTVAVAVGMVQQVATAWVIAADLTWTSSSIVGADEVHSVARTPIGFVAVGSSRVGRDGEPLTEPIPAAWRSDDGAVFGRVDPRLALPDVGAGVALDVAASDDTIIVVGESGEGLPLVLESSAGAAWERNPIGGLATGADPAVGAIVAVTWDGERFVAAGSWRGQPTVWLRAGSAGSEWSTVGGTIGPEGGSPVLPITDIASIDGLVVLTTALDPERPTVWSSNGGGWLAQPVELAMGIAPWGDRFVAVGGQAAVSSPVASGR